MRLGKKGMSIGMVFMFMLAVITFAVIMIFGYKAITDFMGSGEKVEFYQFKTDLESAVKKIYTEYGSVRIETFYLSAKYEKICFVDLEYEGDRSNEELCIAGSEDYAPIACDVWETAEDYAGAEENVFLKPLPPADSPTIKVYQIELGEEGYLCLDVVKGRFKLQLEGLGDRTEISKVVS
ncbi:hypothetical protein GOV03_03615 [Candidatus Woesearchaeota archaeon]|nr:hypothetical protein [Candidatus Woesearchaeota archaeon]